MDKDNFEYELEGNSFTFIVSMQNGELAINESSYERLDDDPTYAMAREIAKLRKLCD